MPRISSEEALRECPLEASRRWIGTAGHVLAPLPTIMHIETTSKLLVILWLRQPNQHHVCVCVETDTGICVALVSFGRWKERVHQRRSFLRHH